MPNHLEQARTGRASCRSCKKAIAKDELRLGVEAASAFGDTPSLQWHHLPCAAAKLPVELGDALKAFASEVPDRAALDATMAEAITKGHAKPAGLPYADRAPTGRARCLQCAEPVAKDALRVAVERELTVGGAVQAGAGYLHPACVAAHVTAQGGDLDELVAGVRANSRIAAAELEAVVAALR